MLQSEAQLAAVGHHWAEAGVVARAATHLHQAGDLAVRVHAFDRAIAHYRRALEAHPLDAGQLAEKLADVLSLRGSFTEARPLFERALALTASEAGIVRARLRSKLGKTWEIAHAHEHALAEYDLAEAELRSVVPLDVESWRRQWIHIQLSRVWVYYWCVRVGDMNRVLDGFIGGWQLNGTYEWQSGEPFLLTGNNLYFPGDASTITSRLGDGDGQGGKFGIDRSAINAPGLVTLTTFGIRNVPTTLDSLRNQPYSVANVGVTKNFKWGEGRRIQIRAEALNALNHPYFGAGMGLNPGTAAAPNAAFGLVTTQRNNPRDIQFGAKFVF